MRLRFLLAVVLMATAVVLMATRPAGVDEPARTTSTTSEVATVTAGTTTPPVRFEP